MIKWLLSGQTRVIREISEAHESVILDRILSQVFIVIKELIKSCQGVLDMLL